MSEECLYCNDFATHCGDVGGRRFYFCTKHAMAEKSHREVRIRRYMNETTPYDITGSYVGDPYSIVCRDHPNIHNLHCKYCQSKLTSDMIVCSRCGAPIHN